ncbi:MAG: LacI family DNA-binding transcriptional regulator [Candidatus Onthomonas sp.]
MPARRITMQDIADACGLSRNTVSKAFNGRGGVPEATRRMILAKAEELGYRQISSDNAAAAQTVGNPLLHAKSIALLTHHMPMHSHYGTAFISAFANRLCRTGYTLMMYEISQEEIDEKRLPANFALDRTAGILGIELFDHDYADMICGLGLPVIFTDTYARPDLSSMAADLITMENVSSTIALTEKLIKAGAREIGFVGDANHCCSFQERWSGFCKAMGRANLTVRKSLCILADDSNPYSNPAWLLDQIERMPSMPDAFVCANDFLALHLITALKKKELRIPQDVMITGFDGTAQADVVEPSLTTVRIPSSDMGYFAAGMLLERMENPRLPFRRNYVQTIPIWNKSIREPV